MCRIGAIPTQTMFFDNHSLVVGVVFVLQDVFRHNTIVTIPIAFLKKIIIFYFFCLGVESHSSFSKKESSRNTGQN